MRRIGVGLVLACVLVLALTGVAAAQGPMPCSWSGYCPDPGQNAVYQYGYGYGYAAGYPYGYSVGYNDGIYGGHGGWPYGNVTYSYPSPVGQPFLRFGGGYTQGGNQGPYLRFGGGYIIDGAHSWGLAGW
jgi:hypothetical protein